MERERNRQRAIDTAIRKARAGHVAGGKCYGYTNVVVTGPDGRRSHVEQRINEPEAKIICRIFDLAAAGTGIVGIAKQLNAEGALAPRSQQGRPRAWIESSIHAALHRSRYRGELVWNKTRKRDKFGQHHQPDRDRSEWITVPMPQLQIVPDDLWNRAHAQITAHRLCTNIRASSRKDESRYLLPGFARCAWCNGGLHVRTRTRWKGDLRFYACTSYFKRGPAVCKNFLEVPMDVVDAKVIAAIKEMLRPDVIDIIVEGVREQLDPDCQPRRRDRIETQLAECDRQAERLAEAITGTGRIAALVAKLKTVEERRSALLQALNDRATDERPRVDWRLVERQVNGS